MSNNKWYGSVNNRIDEGKNYLGRDELKAGDDITMYYYSDRECYYIDEVISQKEIKVKRYYICADHSKSLGCGHQEWLYFKTLKEHHDYIKTINPRTKFNYGGEPEAVTWVKRYGKWQEKIVYNKAVVAYIVGRDGYCTFRPKNEKEQKMFDEGKDIIRYQDLNGKISFGVRDYYYDWEF